MVVVVVPYYLIGLFPKPGICDSCNMRTVSEDSFAYLPMPASDHLCNPYRSYPFTPGYSQVLCVFCSGP